MDRAREKTNKKLRGLERRVRAVYSSDPSLLRIQAKYEWYMNEVDMATHEAYLEYQNAPQGEMRDEAKKAYVKAVRELTIESRQYRDIVDEFTRIMAEVNQKALDIANSEMADIYALNYNQVAVDCKKVGIKVIDNG